MTVAARRSLDDVLATAREFASNELRPAALAYDESEEYPWELFHRGAELGLTTLQLSIRHAAGKVLHRLIELAGGKHGVDQTPRRRALALDAFGNRREEVR